MKHQDPLQQPAARPVVDDIPTTPFILFGNTVSLLGTGAFVVSVVIMAVLWTRLVMDWLGGTGLLVGFATAPMGALYPFIHWVVHGDFPRLYFIVWAVGIAGMAASMGWAYMGRERAESKHSS